VLLFYYTNVIGCTSDLLRSPRRCPTISWLETCSWSTSHYLDPSDLPGHKNISDRRSAAGRRSLVLATNRNGGMLRLNALRHDDDDRLQYRQCPSVCPSVCSAYGLLTRKRSKRREQKTIFVRPFFRNRSSICASFYFEIFQIKLHCQFTGPDVKTPH